MPCSASAPALLTVDLDAILSNWRQIHTQIGPAVTAAAVVKADAYGLGTDRVAPVLAAAGCRVFFVATIDEGVHLRRVVPDGDIFVLCGPLPGAEGELSAHRLTPVLNSLAQLALWRAHAAKRGERLAASLHFDTGMTRLGLDAKEAGRLAADASLLVGLRPVLALSHLACADEAGHAMSPEQRDRFMALTAPFAHWPRSLSASSGLFLGRDYHFDLVRPGAALYGLNPRPGRPNPMIPVVGLAGKILQVRDVDTPMTVGYGATHCITGPGRIATVAVGYADGWFRSLGNRGHGVIGGERVPVVGRISMDLTTFDVSRLPPAVAVPGALIELIGPGHDTDAVAAEAGTIGYEILTALGRRFARHYVGGVQ